MRLLHGDRNWDTPLRAIVDLPSSLEEGPIRALSPFRLLLMTESDLDMDAQRCIMEVCAKWLRTMVVGCV